MEHGKESKNNNTIKLNGTISIYEAADIHKRILQSFTENNTVSIDLSDVDTCDAAGMQLLFSAIKAGEEKGNQIIITQASEAFQETARLIGLQQELFNSSNGG